MRQSTALGASESALECGKSRRVLATAAGHETGEARRLKPVVVERERIPAREEEGAELEAFFEGELAVLVGRIGLAGAGGVSARDEVASAFETNALVQEV